MRKRLFATAGIVALVAAILTPGSASAAVGFGGFENGTAGQPYTRALWSQSGWNASWDQGMDTRTYVDATTPAHSGTKSLRVYYPKGVVGPEGSGAQAPFTLTKGREYYLSYWARLSPDFSFGTTEFSGKMGIGLAGGAACSGGQQCDGYNGFSSRFIWLSGGRAGLYYYQMEHDGEYGDHFVLKNADGTDVRYPRGQWFHVAQRLKVNTVTNGQADANGEIEVFYNGRSAGSATGLRFVRNGDLVDRAYFSSFFGGATTTFAPANDSWIWYDTIKVSTDRAEICEISGAGC